MAMILSALYHDDSSRIFWVKALRKLWWRCPKTKPSSSEFRSNPRGVQSYSKFQLPLVISSRDHQVWKCLTCPKQAYGIPLLPCSLDYLDYTWFHLITLDCFRFRLSDPTLPSYSAVSWRPNPNWNWGHPRDVGSMAPWKPLSAEAWQMGIEHGLHGLQGLQGHCKKSKQFEKSRNFLRNMIQINWKETKSCLGWHQWKQKSCRMLSVIQSGGEWWGVVGSGGGRDMQILLKFLKSQRSMKASRHKLRHFWHFPTQLLLIVRLPGCASTALFSSLLAQSCPGACHAATQQSTFKPSGPVAQRPSGPVAQFSGGPVRWSLCRTMTISNVSSPRLLAISCNPMGAGWEGHGSQKRDGNSGRTSE